MQTASVQTQTDPEICNEALRDELNEALALFRKGTQRLRQSKTDNPRIIEAKQMLYEADGMCKQVDFFLDCLQQVPAPEPVLRAGAALPASARVVDAAGKPNAIAVADTASRVILVGAVAAAGNANAVAVAGDKSRGIRGGPAPADAGTKRAAAALAKTEVVEIISSDDEAEPKRPCLSKPDAGCMAKDNAAEKAPAADDEPKSAPAGGVAKSSDAAGKAAKVVYAVIDGNWQDDVYELQYELRKIGKFDSSELNVEARNEFRTLPYEVALILLGKIRDETTKIRNMNAFIVNLAQKLRTQWSLDDAKTILKEIEPETVEDTESEQDDAEAQQEPPDVDSNGNSIEY